jgi:hypothetical protein
MLPSLIQTKEELESAIKAKTGPAIGGHRYSQKLAEMKAWLDILHPLEGWELESDSNLKIFKKYVDGYLYPFVRGDQHYPNESCARIVSVIRSMSQRHHWDPRFQSIDSIEFLLPNGADQLVYVVQKGQFPVAAREFGMVTTVIHRDNGVDFIAASVDDDKVPSSSWNVRGYSVACWRLTEVDGGIDTSYIAYVDPCGSIPSTLFMLVQSQLAQCVSTVYDYLQEKGPNFDIYLQETTASLDHQKCMISNNAVEVTVLKAGLLVLAVPLSCSSNLSIQVPTGTNVETVEKDEMKLLRLTVTKDTAEIIVSVN